MKKANPQARKRNKSARYRASLKAHRSRTKKKSPHGKRLP